MATDLLSAASTGPTAAGGRLLKGATWPYSVATIVVLLALWFAVTAGGMVPASSLPGPAGVWEAFRSWVRDGYQDASFMSSLSISMMRLALGWLLAVLIGAAIGLLSGINPYAHAIIDPWIELYRAVPPLAYVSLLVLWLGVGEGSKIVLLILSGLPPVAVATSAAVRGVRRERVEASLSLGVGRVDLLRYVVGPSVLPSILTGARVAFGYSFAALIGAEIIAAKSGIAWVVITATNKGDLPTVIAGVLIMGVIAFVIDRGLRVLQLRLTPWVGRL